MAHGSERAVASGHALAWSEPSNAADRGVRRSGSTLAGVLIEDGATGALLHVTPGCCDEALGIVRQSFTIGPQPAAEAGIPARQAAEMALYPVRTPPDVLPKDLAR